MVLTLTTSGPFSLCKSANLQKTWWTVMSTTAKVLVQSVWFTPYLRHKGFRDPISLIRSFFHFFMSQDEIITLGEDNRRDTLSYTNKHKGLHSHDSTGVGGRGAERSWPAGERNAACLRGRPRAILALASNTRVREVILKHNLRAPDWVASVSPPPLVTVKRRQPSSGKSSINLHCIYWSVCCILVLVCPCGWNSICARCKDVKLSLSHRVIFGGFSFPVETGAWWNHVRAAARW